MSAYLDKGKGWMYDFQMNRKRYTGASYKTKTEGKQADAKSREEINNPITKMQPEMTQTDMDFLTLFNRRLDYAKKYLPPKQDV
jgi:hypothetical protein